LLERRAVTMKDMDRATIETERERERERERGRRERGRRERGERERDHLLTFLL